MHSNESGIIPQPETPSGCGKSTLFRLMTCLETEYKGSITINGKTPKEATGTAAFMPQKDLLMPWRNILKNVTLPLEALSMSKAERISQAKEAIEKVGLSGCENKRPSELSGGMRQRLAMARALTCDADLLLMDEPLSALDALLREEMQDMLKLCWREQGYAQVLVTHSVEEAVYLGQRIVVMSPRPGRVVHVLENAEMQQENWRDADLFFERCRTLREMLRDIVAKEEVAHA